jgi:hypothetical protein
MYRSDDDVHGERFLSSKSDFAAEFKVEFGHMEAFPGTVWPGTARRRPACGAIPKESESPVTRRAASVSAANLASLINIMIDYQLIH